MVRGVLTESTNQPKRPKIRSQSQPASKERPAVARTLFGAEKNNNTTLPIPKALTASLPTFDGKSEKFELFEDLFRNNIKLYPHLTEIQKTNYFPSLFRGDALQAFCNIEDSKKDSFEEIMKIFKTSFRRLPINGKSRMRMGCTQIRPLTAKTPRIFRCTSKNCQRGLWIRGPTIHRQSHLCQNARPCQENTQ